MKAEISSPKNKTTTKKLAKEAQMKKNVRKDVEDAKLNPLGSLLGAPVVI
jgi:hypothetical protein